MGCSRTRVPNENEFKVIMTHTYLLSYVLKLLCWFLLLQPAYKNSVLLKGRPGYKVEENVHSSLNFTKNLLRTIRVRLNHQFRYRFGSKSYETCELMIKIQEPAYCYSMSFHDFMRVYLLIMVKDLS